MLFGYCARSYSIRESIGKSLRLIFKGNEGATKADLQNNQIDDLKRKLAKCKEKLCNSSFIV